jgi:uncharacterized protein YchJ
MQETEYHDKVFREFFSEPNEMEIIKKMDERFVELKSKGHTYVRRVPNIERNDKCPCGSGIKFKKCCIDKINQYLK